MFRAEEPFEFPISAEKTVSISVKTFFFFFLEITCFGAEKQFQFPISAEKSVSISLKTFFFFFFGDQRKTVSISDFRRKIRLNFE